MRTEVEIRSQEFPQYPGEEEGVNVHAGIWGKRLAEYLAGSLRREGYDPGEPYDEDWGWEIPIPGGRVPLYVGCGHQSGDDDEFLIMIRPNKPVIRKLFKSIDISSDLGALADALNRILTSDPAILDVRWRVE